MKKLFVMTSLLLLSVFASATALDLGNIQGSYIIEGFDGGFYSETYLANNQAKMKTTFQGKTSNCTGAYNFNTKKSELVVTIPNCNDTRLVFTLDLEKESVESLKRGANVEVAIKMDNSSYPAYYFSIQKLN